MAPTKKSKAPAPEAISLKHKQQQQLEQEQVVGIKSPLDHWSFLDEIEAPMWIDLNSEATGTLHENDDGWFLMTHKFHQCSSRQLISAFSHSGEVCTNSVSGRQEPCSPKLPSSVSKSRGKNYESRVWAQSNFMFATKQHPVKSMSSKLSDVTSEDGKKVKSQLQIDLVKKYGLLPAGVDCDNNRTETTGSSTSKTTTRFLQTKTFSGASVSREGKKNSISTGTTESTKQTEKSEKLLEVVNQTSGQPSKLLMSLRTSLRKNRGTRPATRTDINRVRRSVGTNSSSSKSSVGSSSHPGHDGNNMIVTGILYNDKTPDSRNAMGSYQSPKNILKGSNLSCQKISSGSGQKIETAVQKSTNQETFKAKVQSRLVCPKVLLPQRTHGSDRLIASQTTGKVQLTEQRKRFPGAGKENILEAMKTSKNSLARVKGSVVKVHVQKATKERLPVKKDVGKQKNISCRNGQETSAGMVQKLFLW